MNERPVINTTEARQGVTGHNVRYVLLISCALAIIAFAAVAVVMAH
jgi:hypothetical protein